MKRFLIFSFVSIFLYFLPYSSFASSLSNTGIDLPLGDCLQQVIEHPIAPNFTNFYHSGSNMEITRLMKMAQNAICSMYMMGGREESLTISQVIPIYRLNRSAPVAFQFIYTGQDYHDYHTGSNLLWSISALGTGKYIWNLPGFLGGKAGFGNGLSDNVNAYLISKQEPFKSASTLQMYVYLFGQPLLVARDSTGMVTDVFFQGRTIANPMERAKKYLGKKWYSP